MKIGWAQATTAARILRLGGGFAFAICLLLTAFESRISWFSQEATSAAGDDCDTPLKDILNPTAAANAKAAASDNSGTMRIAGVWPPTIRLGGQLCVAVAGVVPRLGLDRLKNDVDEKTVAANAAQRQHDRATDEANAGNKLAAESEAQAAVAARDQAMNAKDLQDKAAKDRADATAKDKTRADQQKALTAANDALSEAIAAANRGLPAVDVALFLNNRRSPITFKANAVPQPQLLVYEFGQIADAASDDAKFWRDLIAGKTQSGVMHLKIGLSRSQSSGPELPYETPVNFRVFWPSILGLGAVSMAALFAAFAIFAANSTILRDNSLTLRDAKPSAEMNDAKAAFEKAKTDLDTKPNDAALIANFKQADATVKALELVPAGTFSLGRTQMALWLGLSTAGFIFLWLTLGFYKHVITEAILVLLGINSVTGFTAAFIDKDNPGNAECKSFLKDIISDGEGNAQLQRIQMIAWTCILAIIFVWNVIANFVFVEFDAYLLLLMGIASSTYLGFKTQEKPAKT